MRRFKERARKKKVMATLFWAYCYIWFGAILFGAAYMVEQKLSNSYFEQDYGMDLNYCQAAAFGMIVVLFFGVAWPFILLFFILKTLWYVVTPLYWLKTQEK